eukprot:3360872-Alexandrium_andersonii.AAC.1
MSASLVGSEMCIRDRLLPGSSGATPQQLRLADNMAKWEKQYQTASKERGRLLAVLSESLGSGTFH